MGELIHIDGARKHLEGIPADLYKLRWRLSTKNGTQIRSSWTPEIRYPSMRKTLEDFEGDIDTVFVDAIHKFDDTKKTLIFCPGSIFKSISYKGMVSASSGNNVTIGIEVETADGQRVLALRDGTIYRENVK